MLTKGIKGIFFAFLLIIQIENLPGQQNKPVEKFRDPNTRTEERVKDLVSRMTLNEKIGQMVYTRPCD